LPRSPDTAALRRRNLKATTEPVDLRALHRRIRRMIADAESFIAKLPSEAVGVIFMDGDKAVQPDVNALKKYQRLCLVAFR